MKLGPRGDETQPKFDETLMKLGGGAFECKRAWFCMILYIFVKKKNLKDKPKVIGCRGFGIFSNLLETSWGPRRFYM
jgi:hypothetical protein